MPKIFVFFAVLMQLFLTGCHYLLYLAWIFFFPELNRYSWIILPVLLLLSLTFVSTTLFSFRHNRPWVRLFYAISAVWLGVLLYFIFAAVLSLLVFLVGTQFGHGADYRGIAAALHLLALAVIAYGLINARIMRVRKIQVSLRNLPQNWQGKSAVMLSDLHLGHIQGLTFAKRVVRRVNLLQPDLVLIPGDFFDGGYADWTKLAEPFKELSVKHGAYFVTGNHDKLPDNPAHLDALRRAGIQVLDDQIKDIAGLQLVGAGYFYSESVETFKSKLANLKIDPTRPAVLLKHVPVPAHLEAAEQAGIQLQLSGHTHHGQTYPFRYITRRVFAGFDYGLKAFKQMLVYTSSGIGTWGPPLRVATKSEIVQIDFV